MNLSEDSSSGGWDPPGQPAIPDPPPQEVFALQRDLWLTERSYRVLSSRNLVPWVLHPKSLIGTRYEVRKEYPSLAGRLVDPGKRNYHFCLTEAFPYIHPLVTRGILTLEELYDRHHLLFDYSRNRPTTFLSPSESAALGSDYDREEDHFYLDPRSGDTQRGDTVDDYILAEHLVKRRLTALWANTLRHVQRTALQNPHDLCALDYNNYYPEFPNIAGLLPPWPTSNSIAYQDSIFNQVLENSLEEGVDRIDIKRKISTEEELIQEELLFLYWIAYYGNIIIWNSLGIFFDKFIPAARSNRIGPRDTLFWIRIYPQWDFITPEQRATLVLEYYIDVCCDLDTYPYLLESEFTYPDYAGPVLPHCIDCISRELALLFKYKFKPRPHLWRVLVTLFRCFLRDNLRPYPIDYSVRQRNIPYHNEVTLQILIDEPSLRQHILSYLRRQ